MACIPRTLEGWVYIKPTHGPLDGPLYTWAQYTPTITEPQCFYTIIELCNRLSLLYLL